MEILAHRGASGTATENTIAAFKKALIDGCDGFEFDVQQTKDGKIVVFHDWTCGVVDCVTCVACA